MIVRISAEGQYELSENDTGTLNELDNRAVSACQAGNQEQFKAAFSEMLDFVRTKGQRVPDDYLAGSDVILPPADSTLEEVREDFTGEGLIPD